MNLLDRLRSTILALVNVALPRLSCRLGFVTVWVSRRPGERGTSAELGRGNPILPSCLDLGLAVRLLVRQLGASKPSYGASAASAVTGVTVRGDGVLKAKKVPAQKPDLHRRRTGKGRAHFAVDLHKPPLAV